MKVIPTLLLIGAREHTVEKLNRMNIRYVLIQSQQDILTGKLVENIVYVDTYENVSEIIQIAKQLQQRYSFAAVLSFTEFGLYPAAVLAKQLNIKGNAVFPVEYTRDKFKMRQLLEIEQFSSVAFQICTTKEEAFNFFKKMNAPIILKPINGAGSLGVHYVDTIEALSQAWDWAQRHDNQSLIAEEYLLGKEYSVESLSLDGTHQIVAITEKLTSGSPHFIELGHQSPARLTTKYEQKINDMIFRFLNLIRHQNGPAHTEIKVHINEIKIIESQTRMGGDQIWELTELTTGVDVISETVAHLLGLPRIKRNKKSSAAAILFFAREFEEILDVSGIEFAQNISGIVRIHCSLEKGKRIGKLESSESRQGYILGIGCNVEEATSVVQSAMDQIKIKTKMTVCSEIVNRPCEFREIKCLNH